MSPEELRKLTRITFINLDIHANNVFTAILTATVHNEALRQISLALPQKANQWHETEQLVLLKETIEQETWDSGSEIAFICQAICAYVDEHQ